MPVLEFTPLEVLIIVLSVFYVGWYTGNDSD